MYQTNAMNCVTFLVNVMNTFWTVKQNLGHADGDVTINVMTQNIYYKMSMS